MAKQTGWRQLRSEWAVLTLALGAVYRMMRERDDRIAGAPRVPAG